MLLGERREDKHLGRADAERGLARSREANRSLLNGFPAVNYGVSTCRRVVEAVDAPLFARTAAPDCRLTLEVMFAGGFTSCTAGPISFSLGYAKDYPLGRAIEAWQHTYRLIGAYRERGVAINVEHYLPISTLVPHAISMACVILDSLIAAAQGVGDITLGIGQQCHLVQDAATLRAYPRVCRRYLDACGYGDVQLSTVMSQWMGGFPPDEGQAFAVISMAAVAAYLGGATDMITKSPQEAAGIPTAGANVHGMTASKMVLRMLGDQKLTPMPEIAAEEAILEAEACAIVDRALALGEGDAAVGAIRAVEAGVIDVPFSPHRANANQALPARDWRGAVRLMRFGGVPIPKEIQEHHRAELARRLEGKPVRAPWEAAVSAAVIRWQDVSAMIFASMMAVASTPAKDAALRAKANAGWKNLSAAWRGIEAGINKFCADVGLTCDQLLSLAGGRPAAVEWAGRALHPDARASGRIAEAVRDRLWQAWQVRSQG